MSMNSPREVVENVIHSSEDKHHTSTPKVLVLAFLGGAYISIGGLLALLVAGGVPGLTAGNPGLGKILMGMVFPVGLMMVVLAGGELFTGNTAYFTSAVYTKRVPPLGLIRNWVLVYLGNFVGALFVAYVLGALTGVLSTGPTHAFVLEVVHKKVSAPFLQVFCKGIGCNWLVAMAMWLAYSAKDTAGKMMAIWFPVMAFVAMGYEHCVANMFFIPVGMMVGAPVTMNEFFINNLLPATLGNIVGGAILVGLAYGYLYGVKNVKTVSELSDPVRTGAAH